MNRATCLPRPRRVLIAVAMLALVLAQTLGLVHRVVHAHAAPVSHAISTDAYSRVDTGEAEAAWVHRLFGDHHGGSDCDSYDKLTGCDALKSVVVAPAPPSVDSTLTPVHPAWHLAAQAAGFLARGPPAAD